MENMAQIQKNQTLKCIINMPNRIIGYLILLIVFGVPIFAEAETLETDSVDISVYVLDEKPMVRFILDDIIDDSNIIQAKHRIFELYSKETDDGCTVLTVILMYYEPLVSKYSPCKRILIYKDAWFLLYTDNPIFKLKNPAETVRYALSDKAYVDGGLFRWKYTIDAEGNLIDVDKRQSNVF